jgi:hypothetical protein
VSANAIEAVAVPAPRATPVSVAEATRSHPNAIDPRSAKSTQPRGTGPNRAAQESTIRRVSSRLRRVPSTKVRAYDARRAPGGDAGCAPEPLTDMRRPVGRRAKRPPWTWRPRSLTAGETPCNLSRTSSRGWYSLIGERGYRPCHSAHLSQYAVNRGFHSPQSMHRRLSHVRKTRAIGGWPRSGRRHPRLVSCVTTIIVRAARVRRYLAADASIRGSLVHGYEQAKNAA